MVPNKYLAAMIGKSSSEFQCCGLHVSAAEQSLPPDRKEKKRTLFSGHNGSLLRRQPRAHCQSTFGLVIQVLPVIFIVAAELPWALAVLQLFG